MIRCVDAHGKMIGIIPTLDAIKMAEAEGLQLVEVAPNADPPVCRIMDFSKYKYEEAKRQKAMRKHQHILTVKEIKFHVTVADHDFEIKVKHIREFLQEGYKVKLSLQFRGRESLHQELGFDVINKAIKKIEDICIVEQPPKLMGRSISVVVAPRSTKSSKTPTIVATTKNNTTKSQQPLQLPENT